MEVFDREDAAGRGNVGGEGSCGRKRWDGWVWPVHGDSWGERVSGKLATEWGGGELVVARREGEFGEEIGVRRGRRGLPWTELEPGVRW